MAKWNWKWNWHKITLRNTLMFVLSGSLSLFFQTVNQMAYAQTGSNNYNVISYGADPTYVNPSDNAFNSAMNACAGTFGGTVYIPQGHYKLISGFQWKPGCNIVADPAAHIEAGAPISSLFYGLVGPLNSLRNLEFSGGIWDCNGNVANGIWIGDFLSIRMNHFTMLGCNKNSFMSLGNPAASAQNALYLDHAYFYNYGSITPKVVPNNIGIYISGSIANNYLSDIEIVGVDTGIYGALPSSWLTRIHIWDYASQGGGTAGIHLLNYGPVWLDKIEVDGPIKNFAYWFTGYGQQYYLSNSTFQSNGNDRQTYAVQIDLGAQLVAQNNNFFGASSSQRILQDFGGDLSHLSAVGTTTSFVVNGVHSAVVKTGYGNPNSAVYGNPGDMYLSSAGGSNATFWVKESGANTNTGWTAK